MQKSKLLPEVHKIKFILSAIVLLIVNSGCKLESKTSVQSTLNNPDAKCPNKPGGPLNNQNVKQIPLSSQAITESGQLRAGEYLGYAFEAQSGQRLSYQTNNDICIWVYAPDNELIMGKNFTQTGKHIIQISVPKGSTTFDLKLALESSSTSTNSHISTSTTEPNISNSENQAADNFVRNHYIAINNRQYRDSYKNLSSRFINEKIPGGYSEYERWWDRVREIKIGEISVIKQNKYKAIVDAQLWYTMNDGKTFQDSKSRIYLIWSNDTNNWLVDLKS